MSQTELTQVEKLEKLRTAWLPAVEFLFGTPAESAEFKGFTVSEDIAKPIPHFGDASQPFHYTLQIPARSFSNEVMLLADLIQEMTRGLYPVGIDAKDTNALSEGAAIYGAVAAVKQVFGEQTVDSYLNALREQGFAYYDAFSYVSVLLTEDPQAIKKLREIKPFLYEVERSDFDAVGIEIDRRIKDILLMKFRL
ncbi:hypothetical protein DN730_16510 [Marinomonas piezotolerans]|uniref:Uncharacterized protein n=1 Tax=Marinomonas piezotolerans TaxID=2213058 RepID=A0A370U5Q8_9GAMM|nr:hypothetical protein [Marinomonas piezotolerans]RDL43098.1 hypothetical protein DN730_16510 [Marinomonas piezotolerans]